MEFKGTKGKWEVTTSVIYSGEYSLRNKKYAPTFGEDEYNALLISKAPEMLEMLNRVRLGEFPEEEIKQLIEQATKID